MVKKFDINALPAFPYDSTGFKPFSQPPEEVSFDFNKLTAVVALPDALTMQQRQEENNYGKNLKIEISEINLEQANQMIAERQEQSRENLSVHDLMASMMVHIHQIFDFKIVDHQAIKAYHSNLENFGN